LGIRDIEKFNITLFAKWKLLVIKNFKSDNEEYEMCRCKFLLRSVIALIKQITEHN